jgi:SAM-dependent methyltransferase
MPSSSEELQAVRRFWNKNPLYSGESRRRPGDREFFEEHERSVRYESAGACDDPIFFGGVGPESDVLDAGCGIGYWVHQFCKRGARVRACDLSDTAVQLTRRRVELFGLRGAVCSGSVEQLPFRDHAFDHVNCQGVIHHTPNTAVTIEEFHRVLKPGGTLCFSVYLKVFVLRSTPLFQIAMRLGRRWVRLPGRGREGMASARSPEDLVRMYDGADNPIGKAYTRAEVRAMLGDRFDVVKVRRYALAKRDALPFAVTDRLYRRLHEMFGFMIVFRCRRREQMSDGA